MGQYVNSVVQSIRIRQWYKNVLLFLGIVFAGKLADPSAWLNVVLAFGLYCLLSGSEYLINDVLDRKRDRLHPTKRNRPIASGRLPVTAAMTIALIVIVFTLAVSFTYFGTAFFSLSAGFVALVLAYSLVLKHVLIADVLVIATGFVIRAVAGAIAIEVTVSPWLIVCTFLLALFLVLEKRWGEVAALQEKAHKHRASLKGLSEWTLTLFVAISCAALLVSYLIYVSVSEFQGLYITIPFAIYGLFRYMYLVHEVHRKSDPEELLMDRPMLANLTLWVVLVIAVVAWNTLV